MNQFDPKYMQFWPGHSLALADCDFLIRLNIQSQSLIRRLQLNQKNSPDLLGLFFVIFYLSFPQALRRK